MLLFLLILLVILVFTAPRFMGPSRRTWLRRRAIRRWLLRRRVL
jgi:hypothetical protein